MEITKVAIVQGRNEWGPPPVLEARIEILDSSAIPGGEGWISPQLAGLLATNCIEMALDTTDPRTTAAQVVGQLAMTFQRLAGSNVTFAAARLVDEGVALLAFDYENERLARAALDAAMRLYEATREDRPFPFAETIRALRSLANDPGLTPRTTALFPSATEEPKASIGNGSQAKALVIPENVEAWRAASFDQYH